MYLYLFHSVHFLTMATILPISDKIETIEKEIKRPVLFKYRSSKFFVFWTAAVGLFTSVKKDNSQQYNFLFTLFNLDIRTFYIVPVITFYCCPY